MTLAAVTLFGGFCWSFRDERRAAAPHESSADEAKAQAAEPAPKPLALPSVPHEAAAAQAPTSPARALDADVVGPGPDDPHEPGMHPHPMDPARERLHHENALISSLNDAMAGRDVARMRELLVEYRELDPADTDAAQAGYEAIADCIESPGGASLAAAHRFYDTERHSPLRRFVRRICFENGN